jgi:hypothetical protein
VLAASFVCSTGAARRWSSKTQSEWQSSCDTVKPSLGFTWCGQQIGVGKPSAVKPLVDGLCMEYLAGSHGRSVGLCSGGVHLKKNTAVPSAAAPVSTVAVAPIAARAAGHRLEGSMTSSPVPPFSPSCRVILAALTPSGGVWAVWAYRLGHFGRSVPVEIAS